MALYKSVLIHSFIHSFITGGSGTESRRCCLQALEQMKRELRGKMEQEIGELQRRLWTDDDEVYFRELDAERLRRQLHLVHCQARL